MLESDEKESELSEVHTIGSLIAMVPALAEPEVVEIEILQVEASRVARSVLLMVTAAPVTV
jgi:hypothetical protein